jgi:hypothetical protein
VVVLLGLAVLVFSFLPRWTSAPVVTTGSLPPATTAAAPAPAATASPERMAAEPVAPREPAAAEEPEAVPDPPAPPEARHVLSAPRQEPPAAVPPPLPASDFDAAVSEGLAALDRGAHAEARAAFARADALRPGSGVVKDGLARSEAGLRGEALVAHRQRAEAAEAAEDWRGAVREYEAALKLEPSVRFAVEGALRAGQRAEASDRLDFYLRRPDRLSADEVAREAESALDRASEIPSPGRKLARQIEDLRAQLAAAGTEVTVRLLSDEHTDVSVMRVGPLGRFREKSVSLRPGSYVVVGTRRGYRDTRVKLVVPPGRSPEPLTVRCDEAL